MVTLEEWLKSRYYKFDLPAKALNIASKVPGLRHYQKLSNMLTSGADKLQKIEEGYSHFKQQFWIFDDKVYL